MDKKIASKKCKYWNTSTGCFDFFEISIFDRGVDENDDYGCEIKLSVCDFDSRVYPVKGKLILDVLERGFSLAHDLEHTIKKDRGIVHYDEVKVFFIEAGVFSRTTYVDSENNLKGFLDVGISICDKEGQYLFKVWFTGLEEHTTYHGDCDFWLAADLAFYFSKMFCEVIVQKKMLAIQSQKNVTKALRCGTTDERNWDDQKFQNRLRQTLQQEYEDAKERLNLLEKDVSELFKNNSSSKKSD